MSVSIRIAVFTVIVLSTGSTATETCNLYNLGIQGMIPCGMEWWNTRDLGEVVNVTYKISSLVKYGIDAFGPEMYSSLNSSLYGKIQAPSADPLTKMIESALVVEPYLALMVAELVIGLDVSPDEMEQFGLPRELANTETWKLIIKEYLDLSCGSYGVQGFTDCLSNWMLSNCDLSLDKRIYISEWLHNFKSAYCDGAKADSDVVEVFTKDVGSRTKDMLKAYGIARDPESPYLFSSSQNSFNFTDVEDINRISSTCSHYVGVLQPIIMELGNPNSQVGAGYFFRDMMGIFKSFAQCAVEAEIKAYPELEDPSIFNQYRLLMGRYGISEFSPKFVPGNGHRQTVSVFGDPHLATYKGVDLVTCAALGWQTYLFNEFFVLSGYAEPAAENSEASYVTKVRIEFFKTTPVNIAYLSEDGPKPSNRFNYSAEDETPKYYTLDIIEVGDAVKITHGISGTVFVFQKYRDTYYFTVRMGKDIFDLSYGLLIAGCYNPTDISQKRRKRSAECEATCASVDQDYRPTCLFDCDVTGDLEVNQISAGILSIERQVVEEDSKVLEILGRNPAATPLREPEDGGDGGSASCVTSHFTVMSLICILRYI